VGYRQVGLAYDRPPREIGEPKYTTLKLLTLALDGLISFSYKPLRFLMVTGLFVAGLAFLAGVLILLQYITDLTILGYNPRQTQGWTSLILSILFLAGTQLFGMGILGEYIGRIFDESKGRPVYLIDCQMGFDREEKLYPGMISYQRVSGPPSS
jgi:glycosyltransferase involved in cell wall biosynthesis